jgi:hypothetical protein
VHEIVTVSTHDATDPRVDDRRKTTIKLFEGGRFQGSLWVQHPEVYPHRWGCGRCVLRVRGVPYASPNRTRTGWTA